MYLKQLFDEGVVFFSRKFAVAKDHEILMFHAPGKTKEFNPFLPYKKFYGAYDATVSIDWTTDSQ
jgi:periodic tryptophan protein 2